MKKKLSLSGIFSVALICFALSLPAQNTAPAASSHMQGPMPKPTNLQILPKNISHEDLMKVMHRFSGSLGVKCNFCHVVDMQAHHADFASDAKPEKRIARTMMRMTHTINATYLAKVNVPDAKPDQTHVTCGTCHRGQAIPAAFIPPPEPEHHGRSGETPPKAD
ncbi:MAG: c-type cytochrome [Acidobacteriaceae bacterium]